MVDKAPTTTAAGDGRRVVALIAGALVFYAGIVILSFITDGGVPTLGDDADSTVSSGYIVAWALGAGLSSAFGIELAKRIAANFNRVGLILLMVVPILLFAVALTLTADHFTGHALLTGAFAVLGTAVGLFLAFRDLMKPKKPDPKKTAA